MSKTTEKVNKSKPSKVSEKTKKDTSVKSRKSKKNTSKSDEKNIKIDNIKFTTATDVKKGIVFIFFLIFIGVAGYYLFTTSFFNVANVTVKGNTKYSSEEVINTAKINIGKNIFLVWTSVYEKNIETMPYVESAKINKILPNSLEITVKERESRYLAYNKEKNVYYKIDLNGYIVEESSVEKKAETELLTYGLTFDDKVTFGTKINDSDISKLKIFENIYSVYLNSTINMKVTKLTFENSLTKMTLNDKLIVILPNDSNISYNIKFLSGIIKNIGDKAGTVDMTKTNPTFSQLN